MDATKHTIYCFLSLLLLLASNSYYSPVIVHAREIKFFHNKYEPTGAPEYAPAPAPGPATTAPGVVLENYGYGLYGSDSESNSNTVVPQKEQITNNDEYETTRSSSDNNNNNIDDDEEEEMLNKELVNDETTSLEKDESAETYNNDNFNNNNNNKGNGNYFDKRSVSNYYNGAYEGQAGMSDTRYMENGKYYYDIKSDDAHHLITNSGSNNNGYTSTSTTTSDDDETLDPQVYGTGSGYNDFNTLEEEYYQSQAYHNTKEQEYVP